MQDGVRIYYSPQLGRKADILELDCPRVLFRNKPLVTGPEHLLAALIMGRM